MSDLAEILHQKLIPWTRENAGARFIVARPKMSVAEMPDGVQLVRHQITGKRTAVKGHRNYQNTRATVALWPEMRLNEVCKLKLMCVLNGHVNYQLGNYQLRCGAGHFIFIPPGIPHPDGRRYCIDTAKSTFCDLLFFLLHPNAIQCWITHAKQGTEKTKNGYLILNEHLTMLFQVLMEEMTTNEEPDAAVGKNLLSGFFSILLREVSAGRVQPFMGSMAKSPYPGITADVTNDPDDFASRLERYVQAKLQQPLTLEAVARDLFMSRTQFTRTVRQKTGKSFGALINECRMERAKQLLLDSDWTVFAIGTFVGFKSPSYFNTLFREYTGQTPTQFRSLHQK